MTYRLAKKRYLEKAGLVFVHGGWVHKDDAPKIQKQLEAAKAKGEEALKDES